MTKLTSTANDKIKQVVTWQKSAKDRAADGIFIVEGIKLYKEAPPSWIKEVYLTEKILSELGEEYLFAEKDENTYLVTDAIMEKISDTKTPQGILTVLKRPHYEAAQIYGSGAICPLLVILENLQDPGNLGTILRMSEAAGVTGVIISKDTVDVFNPKVVRATMGSIYRMPFIVSEDIFAEIGKIKGAGVAVYAAHLQGSEVYTNYDYKSPTAFMIGNEGNGLSDQITQLADKRLFIPMEGSIESLNAGIAATILAYEAHRQRSANE